MRFYVSFRKGKELSTGKKVFQMLQLFIDFHLPRKQVSMTETRSNIDVLISIHPLYASKIIEGLKTVELRRKFPELNGASARMVIYSTHPVQSIIGYAEIDMVHKLPVKEIWKRFSDQAHIARNHFDEYFTGLSHGFVVQLKKPKKFKTPVPIDYIKEN